MLDLEGELVFSEKKFMDLLEHALNNSIVIYGGGCGVSKVGLEDPQKKKKASHN